MCVLDQKLLHMVTIIYAYNKLEQRRTLWKDIEHIRGNMTYPWILIGDYINVHTSNVRVGGSIVKESEYKDLAYMIESMGMFEAKSKSCHYTWSNKSIHNTIYSRIKRMIGIL